MIFQTRLKCKDGIVNLVIDNGSAISFLAQEIIGKLHWPSDICTPAHYASVTFVMWDPMIFQGDPTFGGSPHTPAGACAQGKTFPIHFYEPI